MHILCSPRTSYNRKIHWQKYKFASSYTMGEKLTIINTNLTGMAYCTSLSHFLQPNVKGYSHPHSAHLSWHHYSTMPTNP